MKPWLKTALKIAAVLALIPALTFTAIFGGGYVYGRLQCSRHQRTAQSCLENSRDALEESSAPESGFPSCPRRWNPWRGTRARGCSICPAISGCPAD